jgi:hypothetical protein
LTIRVARLCAADGSEFRIPQLPGDDAETGDDMLRFIVPNDTWAMTA